MSGVLGGLEIVRRYGPIATAVYVRYHEIDPAPHMDDLARLDDLGTHNMNFDKTTCDAIFIGCGIPLEIRKELLSTSSLFKFILTADLHLPDEFVMYEALRREIQSRTLNTITLERSHKSRQANYQYFGTFTYKKKSDMSEVSRLMEVDPEDDGARWCSVDFNPVIFKESRFGTVDDLLRRKIIRTPAINPEGISKWMADTRDEVLRYLNLEFLQRYCITSALGIGPNKKNMLRNLKLKFKPESHNPDHFWNQFEINLCIGGPIYLANSNLTPAPTEAAYKVVLDSEIFLSCVSVASDTVCYPGGNASYPKESQIYKKGTNVLVDNVAVVARFLFFLPEQTFKEFTRILEVMKTRQLHSFDLGIEAANTELSVFLDPIFTNYRYQNAFQGATIEVPLRTLKPATDVATQSTKRARGVEPPSAFSSSNSASSSSTILLPYSSTQAPATTIFPFLTETSSGSTPFFAAPVLYPSLSAPTAQASAPDPAPRSPDSFNLTAEYSAAYLNEPYKTQASPSKQTASPDPFAFSTSLFSLSEEDDF